MEKKLFSIFLILCMVMTLLPIPAMAEQSHIKADRNGDIIVFAPLAETEKSVAIGTSIEELELPKTLTATVLTNPDLSMQVDTNHETVLDSVYDSGYENIPVNVSVAKWTSEPEYDMDTEGEYVFKPVIEGYIVNALLPEIAVTVAELPPIAAARGLVAPMSVTNYGIWVGGVQVTDDNKNSITGAGIMGSVTYNSDTNTLTLHNANITNAYTGWGGDTFCIYSEESTLILNLIGENSITGVDSVQSTYGIRCRGKLTIEGEGKLTVTPGKAYITDEFGNNHSSGILTQGGLTINNVILDIRGEQFGIYEYGDYNWDEDDNITINGGTVTAYGGEAAIMVDGNLKTNGKKVSIMVGDEEPGHEWDGSTNLIETYKYVKIELTTDVAQIGETGYATLQGAVNAIAEGDTIQLLADITLTSTVTISSNHNVTIDLNGKTLKNDSSHVIHKTGNGKLTITDSGSGGKVECTSTSGDNHVAIYDEGAGEVIIKGGTISAYKMSIVSTNANGMVSIHGGVISSAASNAIQSDNTVNVYGGTVISAGGNGLSAITGNIVNVSDGMVENTNGGHAIVGNTLSISGGIIQNNAEHGNTIAIGFYGISLTLTGGTIENSHSNGTAIYAGSTKRITIPSGTVTIKGGGKAMTKAPDLSEGMQVAQASKYYNGNSPEPYEELNIVDYKYLAFGPTTAPGAPTDLEATPGDGQLNLTWNAPTNNGGSPIAEYEVSMDGGSTWTGTIHTSFYANGLDNGTNYNIQVRAVNAVGKSAAAFIIATPVVPTYTISGVITGSDTNSGIVAIVQLKKYGDSDAIIDTVMTNTDGTYIISNVPTGTYSIDVSATGYHNNAITSFLVATDVMNKNLVLMKSIVTHTITATASTGGSISPSGGVTVNNDTSQTFTITPTSNYSIADVKVDGVSQGRIASYTFSNVTANHTIAATFSYNGGSGSSSDDSDSNSDSSNNSNTVIIIVTPPAPDKPDSPTQAEIKLPVTVDGNHNATVNITSQNVADAFNKALADAKKNGNEQNGITVVLRVDAGSKTGSNVRVNLPKAVQDTIIKNKVVNTIIVVDNPDIRIGMDLETVQEINSQAKSDVNITATRTDNSELNEGAKDAIGNRPVFDLQVNYGTGRQVQKFGDGSVTVTIPYTLGANEKAENVKAVYIDENGKLHWLENSVYDSVEKVVRFSTNHFSIYAVGYKQTQTESTDTDRDTTVTDTTSADISFTDIADHWAKADIEYVVRQGLFNGMSTATFSPNTAMTRGMFVTVLGRMSNADVNSYKKSSFTDVPSDAYYMGYLEWASKNSIVKGIGNGEFAPNQSITREQMAVIINNYAKNNGIILPKVHEKNTFADSANISAYAKDAVQQMQMAGVIGGKDRNLFDPQGTATRAEVAAVLRRFMELAISNDAM